tara:strand:- start:363 stop:581 length:219 start_codon:yes stop_codon:yes gene_type:complete
VSGNCSVGGAQRLAEIAILLGLFRLGGVVIRDGIPMGLTRKQLSGESGVVKPLLVYLLHLDLLTENVALQHM